MINLIKYFEFIFPLLIILSIILTPLEFKYITITVIAVIISYIILLYKNRNIFLLKININKIYFIHILLICFYLIIYLKKNFIDIYAIRESNQLPIVSLITIVVSLTLFVFFPGIYIYNWIKTPLSLSILYGFSLNSFIMFLVNIIRFKLLLNVKLLVETFLLIQISYLLISILLQSKQKYTYIKINIKVIVIFSVYIGLLIDFILNVKPLLFGDHWYAYGWNNYVLNNLPEEYSIKFMIYPWGYPFYSSSLLIIISTMKVYLINVFAWTSLLNVIFALSVYSYISSITSYILNKNTYNIALALALILIGGGISSILLFPYIINNKLNLLIIQKVSEYTSDAWWSTHNPLRYLHLPYTVGLLFALAFSASIINQHLSNNTKNNILIYIFQIIMIVMSFLIHVIDVLLFLIIVFILLMFKYKINDIIKELSKILIASFIIIIVLDYMFNLTVLSFTFSRINMVFSDYTTNYIKKFNFILIFVLLLMLLVINKAGNVSKIYIRGVPYMLLILVLTSFLLWVLLPKKYYYSLYVNPEYYHFWRLGIPTYFILSAIGPWLLVVSVALIKMRDPYPIVLVLLFSLSLSLLIIGKRLLIIVVIHSAILSSYIVQKTMNKNKFLLFIYIILLFLSITSGGILHQRLILDSQISSHNLTNMDVNTLNYIISKIPRNQSILTFDEKISWKVSLFTAHPTVPKPRPTMYTFKPYGEFYDKPLWISNILINLDNPLDFAYALSCSNVSYIYIDKNNINKNVLNNINTLIYTNLIKKIYSNDNISIYLIKKNIKSSKELCKAIKDFNLISLDNKIELKNVSIYLDNSSIRFNSGELLCFYKECLLIFENSNIYRNNLNKYIIHIIRKYIVSYYANFTIDISFNIENSKIHINMNNINLNKNYPQYNILFVFTWNKSNSMIYVVRVNSSQTKFVNFIFDVISKNYYVNGSGIVFSRYDKVHSREYSNIQEVNKLSISIIIYKIKEKHEKVLRLSLFEFDKEFILFINKLNKNYIILETPFNIKIMAKQIIFNSSYGELEANNGKIMPHGNQLYLINSTIDIEVMYTSSSIIIMNVKNIKAESWIIKQKNIIKITDHTLIMIYNINKYIIYIVVIYTCFLLLIIFYSFIFNKNIILKYIKSFK